MSQYIAIILLSDSACMQRDAAALNARESVAFADVTQLGEQINVNMPESIATLFQHQSQVQPTAGRSGREGNSGQGGKEGEGKSARPSSDPAIPNPPSPIVIRRAQISGGKLIYRVTLCSSPLT